jgi:hypothetical protein
MLAHGRDPSHYGANRQGLIPGQSSDPSLAEIDSLVRAFGGTRPDCYVGAPVDGPRAALRKKVDPVWILGAMGSPLAAPERCAIAMLAVEWRLGLPGLFADGPVAAARTLVSAVEGVGANLAVASRYDGVGEWSRALERAMGRRTRKALVEQLGMLSSGGDEIPHFCNAAFEGALRAGLLAAGDPNVVLAVANRLDPGNPGWVRRLLAFWLSPACMRARITLGVLP